MEIGVCIIENNDIRFINQSMLDILENNSKNNDNLNCSDTFYKTYIDYIWRKINNNYGFENIYYRIITNEKKVVKVYGHLFGNIKKNIIIMQVYNVLSKAIISKADIVYEDEGKYLLKINSKEIINAVEINDFIFVYQPILNRKDNIIAVESLIRLNHPINQIVTPDKFLDKLINLYDMRNLNKIFFSSCIRGFNKLKQSRINIALSINCSLRQLQQINLTNDLIEITTKYNINPQNIWIEINEKVKYDDIIESNIKKLRENGFVIVLDDFGVKNANLNTIQMVHFEIIKIDRSFIQNIVNESISFDIIKMIIELCHKNNIKVVVEGIETKQQAEIIDLLAYDYVQGYYYSKPVELHKLMNMMEKGE